MNKFSNTVKRSKRSGNYFHYSLITARDFLVSFFQVDSRDENVKSVETLLLRIPEQIGGSA